MKKQFIYLLIGVYSVILYSCGAEKNPQQIGKELAENYCKCATKIASDLTWEEKEKERKKCEETINKEEIEKQFEGSITGAMEFAAGYLEGSKGCFENIAKEMEKALDEATKEMEKALNEASDEMNKALRQIN